MRTRPHATVLALVFASQVSAYNAGHGPFAGDASVARVTLKAMTRIGGNGNTTEPQPFRFTLADDPGTELVVYGEGESYHVALVVGGTIRFAKAHLSDFCTDLGIEAYAADLNRDGQRDFMVYSYSGGCGLAAGYCDIGFLLSDAAGYRLTTVQTLWPSPDNYVMLGGRPCFVHTSFGHVDRCNDDKGHNFWVYNLLVVDGANLRLDNTLAPGFPKTIWYTFRPNHEETDIITSRQKTELVRRSQAEVFPPSSLRTPTPKPAPPNPPKSKPLNGLSAGAQP